MLYAIELMAFGESHCASGAKWFMFCISIAKQKPFSKSFLGPNVAGMRFSQPSCRQLARTDKFHLTSSIAHPAFYHPRRSIS
jgi:hypothetical protein